MLSLCHDTPHSYIRRAPCPHSGNAELFKKEPTLRPGLVTLSDTSRKRVGSWDKVVKNILMGQNCTPVSEQVLSPSQHHLRPQSSLYSHSIPSNSTYIANIAQTNFACTTNNAWDFDKRHWEGRKYHCRKAAKVSPCTSRSRHQNTNVPTQEWMA